MGIYLSSPKTEKFSEEGENSRLKFGLSSMQGWRANMEDAHTALPDLDDTTSFFGVFDGHGGKVVAKFCAKFMHTQVLNNEANLNGDLGASLQKAFFRMDDMMRGQRGWRELSVLGDKMNKFTGMIEGLIWSPRGGDSSDQHDDWAFEEGPHSDFLGPTSGSTACVAVIRNNQLTVANAGDSRCVISRKGQAYNLSRDHKPELEAERDRILKAGGFIHAGRVNGSLNLSRAIGDMEFKQNKFMSAEKQIVTANPDINIVELCEDDDFIVIACDGIWDCMSSQQLVDFIHEQLRTETRLSTVCERVLDRCLAPSTAGGEGCDNMTMILVQFKKPIVAFTTDISSNNNTDASGEESPTTTTATAENSNNQSVVEHRTVIFDRRSCLRSQFKFPQLRKMDNRRNARGRGQGDAPEPAQAAVPVPQTKFTTLCQEYNQLGGTKFDGSESIIKAQEWILDLERIFTGLVITDAQKRQLAAWQLHGAARNWWRTVTAQTVEEYITWQQFRDVFETKWIPESGQSNLYREFMDLKQGNMTFAEYERKFDELSQYGPGLVNTPLKKNEMFINGARPEYYDRLVNHVHGSFANMLDMARRFESPASKGKQAAATSQASGASSSAKKRKPNYHQQRANWQNTHGIGYPAQRPPTDISAITCFRCNQKGHYANSCTSGAAVPPPQTTRSMVCHICLQPGHYRKDCPSQQRGKTSGVFAMSSTTPPAPDNEDPSSNTAP